MLSIGELAGRTGVSRRMLRHWGDVGLLSPAAVDEQTGYRWYARGQAGRVRAIATLRAVGFGLDEIADLLGSRLTESRLVELLRVREGELAAQIDEASARLTEVRKRLHALERGRHVTMDSLELAAIPPLHLACLQAQVADETEIGHVVGELLTRLREHLGARHLDDADIVITYFGPPGDARIEVSAGIEAAADVAGLTSVDVPGAERGVTVRYDNGPGGVGDAWITLDAALEPYGLRTTGVYRQRVPAAGPVRLQAPVESTADAGA
jgi:DNA-binding transcriptional MerR regulator